MRKAGVPLAQSEKPDKKPDVQQIGEYTVTSTNQSMEIRRGETTFAFTPTEIWDLFDLLHDQAYSYYVRMREVGLEAYPALSTIIHLPCCEYLLEGLLRRGELIPATPGENGATISFVADFVEQMHFKDERERDQQQGWPASPDEPITPHWTRMNDTLILCASTIAARYGTQQAQSSSPWRVSVDYTVLADLEINIQLGFWRLRHPEADDQSPAEVRQAIKDQLGKRQGTATYTPDEFLKNVSSGWSQPNMPMILEYDATTKYPRRSGQRLVVAKLYPGGVLKPCIYVYRSLA